MKLLICLFVCFVTLTNAALKEKLNKAGKKIIEYNLNCSADKCNVDRSSNLDVSEINVHYYEPLKNNTKKFKIKDAAKEILAIKGLDKNNKFIIYVGGFKSQIGGKQENLVRETFKTSKSHLIIVDHSHYTNDNDNETEKNYERSIKHVFYIGYAIGGMLASLVKGGVSPKNMHCIGHSLGSQILGQTGEYVHKNTNEKIWRITALDPAGPCFSDKCKEDQVRAGVAEYVEVYHCNPGQLGTDSVLADINLFVEIDGQSPPKDKDPKWNFKDWLSGKLGKTNAVRKHGGCINVYMATVKNPTWFTACKSDDYKISKDCLDSSNEKLVAGYGNPGKAKGVFYFSTKGHAVE